MSGTTTGLSPELALAAACALYDDALGDVAQSLMEAPGFDWQRFGRLTEYHGVELVAYTRLAALVPADLAPVLAENHRLAVLDDVALETAHTRTTARILRVLEEGGVRALVIKGAGVAHLLYAPHPEFRRANDVDILIAPEDLDAADRALAAAGLIRQWPAPNLPEAARPMLLQLANVFDYRSAVFDELVELHFRPTNNPFALPVTFAEFYGSSIAIETAHGRLRMPDGPLLVLYLCHHALTSVVFRLKWFGDIARALRRAGESSCEACLARWPRPLPLGPARLADELFARLDSGIRQAAAGEAGPLALPGLTARIARSMEDELEVPAGRSLARLPSDIADQAMVMRLLPGPRARARQLLLALSDRRDALTLRLGPRFAIIYGLLGPVLALGRLIGRSGARGEPDK